MSHGYEPYSNAERHWAYLFWGSILAAVCVMGLLVAGYFTDDPTPSLTVEQEKACREIKEEREEAAKSKDARIIGGVLKDTLSDYKRCLELAAYR